MTQEEKARAYDKSLARAKELYSQHCAEWRDEDIEYIFPELAKSEDEKVRKALLELVHDTTGDELLVDYGVHKEEALDWLEKQGANSPVLSNSANIGKDEQKQEWSEEDINMIDWLIRCCEEEHKELCNDKYGHQDIVSDLKRDCRKKWDWLESLKNRVAPHNTWKPSHRQIKVCKEVYADILSAKGFDLGTVVSELNRMEEQLKKLKEE